MYSSATGAPVQLCLYAVEEMVKPTILSAISAGVTGRKALIRIKFTTSAELRTGESEAELTVIVRNFLDRLTGRQTVYRMIELSRQITFRGGSPQDPIVYKKRYLNLLDTHIAHRWRNCGRIDPRQAASQATSRKIVMSTSRNGPPCGCGS
jgi:hypothetical protein